MESMKVKLVIVGVLVLLIAAGVYALTSSQKVPTSESTMNDITNLTASTTMSITLTSSAFAAGGLIPKKYSCDGTNVNPELSWSGAPVGTKSFALIMDDPDIPDAVKQSRGIDVFDHWVVYNIPGTVTEIKEATKPEGQDGLNGSGKPGYVGPCPPDKEHRYFFYIFALDTTLTFNSQPTKADVMGAMIGHVLADGQLMGRYNRSPQ